MNGLVEKIILFTQKRKFEEFVHMPEGCSDFKLITQINVA